VRPGIRREVCKMSHEFEKMMPGHEEEVMEIFNYYTENSFAAFPEGRVTNKLFLAFLGIGKTHPSYVIKSGEGAVIGFCMLRPYSPFPVFNETAKVSYFIKPGFTGMGIGKAALMKLEDDARELRIKHLLADISSENSESIGFHKMNGFSQCGCFQNIGRKFGKPFSVVWMEKEL